MGHAYLETYNLCSKNEGAVKEEIRFQQLNKYESGLNLPPAEMLIKLAYALGSTVDYLLTGNHAEEMPLGNTRPYKRFKAVEDFGHEHFEKVVTCLWQTGVFAEQLYNWII